MRKIFEAHRGQFTISTDNSRLDVDAICDFLSRAYWAKGRPRERTERALENSLVFGLYDGEKQIGIARVVTDYAIFAYLCDVFVHEDYRSHGLGKWLIETVTSHPDLQGLRRWTLATRDAHGLYKQFGWDALGNAENWMEIFRPFTEEGRD
ncbi:MAG TPA: GNAT family N-acetyltransferase [Anaerolineales bacterium]|nr:GNAT family N-acetyltransferase [Anaerolineales bacterium]HMR99545.1 GNAT family N-acetyltransferase [Anaerolineales bacterium]HNQ94710.1 GNAT family N-acetyltransferase [Anaerolineales bacterium]HNS59774.1 GNAT family N-acetyltransferase [Anaerolineales bacterium]